VALYVLILAVVSPVLAAQSTTLSRLLPERWFPGDGAATALSTPKGTDSDTDEPRTSELVDR